MTIRLLIVDDETYIRRLIEQALEELEEEGVEILTATDGAEALEVIQKERPGLVFMDVMVPIINGFDVCRMIKQDLRMDDVYIVMLTAKGQEFDRQTGGWVGADEYITKPFDPDQLLAIAREVLHL
jgi:two-component system alkaline phosphatase synthesis response regulator PhoP